MKSAECIAFMDCDFTVMLQKKGQSTLPIWAGLLVSASSFDDQDTGANFEVSKESQNRLRPTHAVACIAGHCP